MTAVGRYVRYDNIYESLTYIQKPGSRSYDISNKQAAHELWRSAGRDVDSRENANCQVSETFGENCPRGKMSEGIFEGNCPRELSGKTSRSLCRITSLIVYRLYDLRYPG